MIDEVRYLQMEIKKRDKQIAALDADGIMINKQLDILHANLSRLTAEIAELKADNEILRNMNKINKKSVLAMSAKLSRLTAALHDDERAERVQYKGKLAENFDDIYLFGRHEGIKDYRAMLKEEMGI